MARTLDQILSDLNPSYSSSEKIIQNRLGSIQGEVDAGIAQADAKLDQANTDILNSSRRRGLGFSGIPVGEQSKYAATEYAPAVANLKATGLNKELTLQEQLAQLARDKRAQGQSIFENEQARALQERQFQESIRQFNENQKLQQQQLAAQRAASAASSAGVDLSSYLGGGSTAQAKQSSGPSAADAAIYNRAKSLASLWNSDKTAFLKTVNSLRGKNDNASKNVIVTAYKLAGMGNAQALKKWGLI